MRLRTNVSGPIFLMMFVLTTPVLAAGTEATGEQLTATQGDINQFSDIMKKGKAAHKQRDYGKAAEFFERAVALQPDNQEAHYFLGVAYDRIAFRDGSEMHQLKPRYIHKASAEYEKVIAISPSYEGDLLILDPYSKLTSCWGALACFYAFHGKPDSAVWAFQTGRSKGGFHPEIVQFNRNMISRLERDAVLMTNGDNDTFPMWYIQHVECFRRDVTIVNVSMLNATWYIKQLRDNYLFGHNNLYLDLTDADIDGGRTLQTDGFEANVQIDPNHPEAGEFIWEFKPRINNWMLISDQIVVRIFEMNGLRRPIYFAVTIPPAGFLGLEDHMSMEGLVYRIVQREGKKMVNQVRLEENVWIHYTYAGLLDENWIRIDKFRPPSISHISQNYAAAFTTVGFVKRNEGLFADAMTCLEAALQISPEMTAPKDILGWCYMELGDTTKAIQFYETEIKNSPDVEGLRMRLAGIYERMDDYEPALAVLDDLIMASPTYRDAYETAARFAMEMERYDLAREYADAWLQVHPQDSTMNELMEEINESQVEDTDAD